MDIQSLYEECMSNVPTIEAGEMLKANVNLLRAVQYIVHLYQSNLIDKKQANRAKHYYEKRFGPKQSSITTYSSGFIACRSWQGPTSLFIVFLPIQTGCAIIIIKQRAVGARRRVCTVLPSYANKTEIRQSLLLN